MRLNILLFSILLFLFCHKKLCSQAQIFQLRAEKLKIKGDNYFYEDDSISITFAFWAEKGAFNFRLQNKLDAPLYVDWFKTTLLAGAHKLDFYTTDTSADFKAFEYAGPIDDSWFGTAYGTENFPPRIRNNDRKTFLPPKATYYSFNRRVYHILPIDYFSIPERCDRNFEQPNRGRGKPVLVLSKQWSRRETPLTVRFYLTLCRDENLQECRSYDFDFFLTQFYECPQEHFRGRPAADGGFSYPFRRQDSFYILFPEK